MQINAISGPSEALRQLVTALWRLVAGRDNRVRRGRSRPLR
jgi:hypothetical protein